MVQINFSIIRKLEKYLHEIKMNNFEDFFKAHQEYKLEIKGELIFEHYFDSLCSFQSKYDFYKFLDDFYEHASGQAKNCIEMGFNIKNIEDRQARNWIESVTECINSLLGKFLIRKGVNFDPNEEGMEKKIYNKIKDLGGPEWLKIGNKLKRLWHKSRCNVAHTTKGLQLSKSPKIFKEALKHKDEYVEVHMESLKYIRKYYPNYNK